jgi:hypothetical protein
MSQQEWHVCLEELNQSTLASVDLMAIYLPQYAHASPAMQQCKTTQNVVSIDVLVMTILTVYQLIITNVSRKKWYGENMKGRGCTDRTIEEPAHDG